MTRNAFARAERRAERREPEGWDQPDAPDDEEEESTVDPLTPDDADCDYGCEGFASTDFLCVIGLALIAAWSAGVLLGVM